MTLYILYRIPPYFLGCLYIRSCRISIINSSSPLMEGLHNPVTRSSDHAEVKLVAPVKLGALSVPRIGGPGLATIKLASALTPNSIVATKLLRISLSALTTSPGPPSSPVRNRLWKKIPQGDSKGPECLYLVRGHGLLNSEYRSKAITNIILRNISSIEY